MMLDAPKRFLLTLSLLVASSCLLAACSEEEDEKASHAEPAPDCQAIGDACTHDVSGEFADECHEVYHDNDAAECAQRKDECLDYCQSHGGEGGASGAGH